MASAAVGGKREREKQVGGGERETDRQREQGEEKRGKDKIQQSVSMS